MIKIVEIKDNKFRTIETYVIETLLTNDIEIMKKVINIEGKLGSFRDITKDSYFDLIDWEYRHYTIDDVEIHNI